ncbi:DNA internalization-related competence protein ComEC/Rec2 [Paenibacillus pini]|uniref:Late competence protein ComEC n=1 Tax=Paenibacillus pini JCM 16418 TaxID=1236976 RepID=W7YEP9_9BACL|nr:DNA internalization-related competence protein ComEC/Rec2 [Paenibacillus pini]GAF06987.1 late competence protein ComEC [Paenibacillus pini JCM 16418]
MKSRPLLMFTICWILGSSCAYFASGTKLVMIWIGLSLLLAIPVILRRKTWGLVLMMWLAILLSGLYWEWKEIRNVSLLPEEFQQVILQQADGLNVQAQGKVVSSVDVDGDRADFEVELEELSSSVVVGNGKGKEQGKVTHLSERVLVQVKLKVQSDQQQAGKWQRGDYVKLSGTMVKPAEARNFGGFDYGKYLRTQEVHWIYKVKGLSGVQCKPPASWSLGHILRWNDQVRDSLGAKLDLLFHEPHAGYMKGLIIGMQDDLDPETFRQFSQLGLTHILAISGMHVAVYVAVLLFILSLFRVSRERALTIVMVLVPVYVLLSGLSPSVVRAGVMSIIALYAARRGILKDGMNILAASALLMLIWNPYYLLSVSFQLSFLVTAGLMVYVPLLQPLLRFMPQRLGAPLGVTLIAQLVSFPLTIYYFNQFSLLSFAANFILVPVITFLVLPLGTAALIIGSLWNMGGRGVAWITECLDDITFWLVERMNDYPSFVTIWRSPSLVWIVMYYVLLYVLLYLARSWAVGRTPPVMQADETVLLGDYKASGKKISFPNSEKQRYNLVMIPVLASLVILMIFGYQPERRNGTGLVQFLDIGQGDSILITTPEGKNILVDGGGTVSFRKPEDAWKERRKPFEVGGKVLVPLLKQRGIHRLDAVILSHGDQDHAGGLQSVLDQIPVNAFFFNGTLAGTVSMDKLLSTALNRKIPLYAVHEGMVWSPDELTRLDFIYPQTTQEEQEMLFLEKNQNHASLVFILSMGGSRFLFTGDMDKAAETALLDSTFASPSSKTTSASPKLSGSKVLPYLAAEGVDVIKVAHHGSKTSSSASWLKAWQPKAAVISAGQNNLYGHPHAEVVGRIKDQNATIYRTDQQGEIQMLVKNGKIQIRYRILTKS